MILIVRLPAAVKDAFANISALPCIAEAEVFASASTN